MSTVTRLTNKKRRALIIKKIMREAKEKDPHCMVYDTTLLSQEICRQLTARRKKHKAKGELL